MQRAAFVYVVRCQMIDAQQAERMLAWLREGHCREVCEGGATEAEVILLDGSEGREIEIRYRFADRASFERYERDHAPRLRAEGLARFAGEMEARRWTGEVLHLEGPSR